MKWFTDIDFQKVDLPMQCQLKVLHNHKVRNDITKLRFLKFVHSNLVTTKYCLSIEKYSYSKQTKMLKKYNLKGHKSFAVVFFNF